MEGETEDAESWGRRAHAGSMVSSLLTIAVLMTVAAMVFFTRTMMIPLKVLSFRGENLNDGEPQNRRGRNGKDVIVRVSPGTIVQEEVAEGVPPNDANPNRPAIHYGRGGGGRERRTGGQVAAAQDQDATHDEDRPSTP